MDLAAGYRPTRDQMRDIVAAARALHRLARRWRRLARLPGYPVEQGNLVALKAVFRLERALNPGRLARGSAGRLGQAAREWPDGVVQGLAWVDNLLGILAGRNGLGSMVVAVDFPAWAAEEGRLPETVTVQEEELEALREAIRLLPRPGELPESDRPAAPSRQAGPGRARDEMEAAGAVVLFGPRAHPVVLGKRMDPLRPVQFRVIKALLDAGDDGLSKKALEKSSGSGDAVGVLKRLANSDPDWQAVIGLAGKPGLGYRLRPPSIEGPPLPARTPPYAAAPVARTHAQRDDSRGG